MTRLPRAALGRIQSGLPVLLFLSVVAAVYSAGNYLAGNLPTMDRPGAVATGMLLDMVVLVPAAFYVLVVRRRGLPMAAMIPVLVLSVVAASKVLPEEHHSSLRILELLIIPLEIGLVTWIVWKTTRAIKRTGEQIHGDPLERLCETSRGLIGDNRAAALFASEVAMFIYVFGGWRGKPDTPVSARAFTHHEKSGHGGILLGLLFVVAFEGLAVHFLLANWSVTAAWIFTAASIYGALWLIADYRATVMRPVLVDSAHLVIRAGLRWTLRVPLGEIAALERNRPETLPKKEIINLTFLGTPRLWIVFRRPVPAEGPYGMSKPVRAVGLDPDDPVAFAEALRQGRPG